MPFDLGQALFGNHPLSDYAGRPITDLISAILPNIFVLAGLIIFLYFVFGGFLVISSAGGDPQKAEQGKQVITQAALGFAIIFSSYWIIQIIQILTGIPILNSKL
jgi:ABC-type antimicrobial peptide transport system permease subunit